MTASARLQRVRAALETGAAPAPDDAAWLAEGIARAMDGSGCSLEQALGLRRRGGTSLHHAAKLARRDEQLRLVRQEHFPEGTAAEAAAAMTRAVRRGNPQAARVAGSKQQALLEAAAVTGRLPGPKHLQTILAGNSVGPLDFQPGAEP